MYCTPKYIIYILNRVYILQQWCTQPWLADIKALDTLGLKHNMHFGDLGKRNAFHNGRIYDTRFYLFK